MIVAMSSAIISRVSEILPLSTLLKWSEYYLLEPILGDLTYSVPMVDTKYLIRSDLNQTVRCSRLLLIACSTTVDSLENYQN